MLQHSDRAHQVPDASADAGSGRRVRKFGCRCRGGRPVINRWLRGGLDSRVLYLGCTPHSTANNTSSQSATLEGPIHWSSRRSGRKAFVDCGSGRPAPYARVWRRHGLVHGIRSDSQALPPSAPATLGRFWRNAQTRQVGFEDVRAHAFRCGCWRQLHVILFPADSIKSAIQTAPS